MRLCPPYCAISLLRGGHAALRRFGLRLGAFLLKPNAVVLLGPVEVNCAVPHRFEGALHPDCADINVSQHGGDEQHCDRPVGHLG